MTYNIISTGSKGNAVLINDFMLIDCGVPYKALNGTADNVKIVLLTHIHGDHFKKSAIKKLAFERPTLRFACGNWLVAALLKCGVDVKNIDVLKMDKWYDYGLFKISPFELCHDVENCGYRVEINGERLFYATDTNTLCGIEAKNYDLYMVECNYEDEEIKQRIIAKKSRGEYSYEEKARERHLSKAGCDNFIYSNIGSKGEYVYLHMHEGTGD